MNGASVKVFSKAKNGSEKLSANFKVKEFACKVGSMPAFLSTTGIMDLGKRSVSAFSIERF